MASLPRGRSLVAFGLAGAAALVLTLVTTALVAPRGVWLEATSIPAEIDGEPLTPAIVAERLASVTRALSARARAEDELAGPATRPALTLDTGIGTLAAAARGVRSALGRGDGRVAVEVTAQRDHLEIAVRERATQATVASRIPRGRGALDRLIESGAFDLLLMIEPLDAAVLVAQDPHGGTQGDALDEVLAMLARVPSAAGDPRALLVRAMRDALYGDCRSALEGFDRVIAQRADAPRPYVLAADCLARVGERDRALERLIQAARQARDAPLALSLTGQAYRRIGHAERGLQLLQVAHTKDPALPGNAVAIGEALLALHRPAEALAWLEAHAEGGTDRARWLAAVGLAQVRTGAGPAAQATANALRQTDSASLEATRIEAELAAATKAWPQALGRFGALRLMAPHDGAARAGEGYALIQLRRYDDAMAAFTGCAEAAPWLAECRLGLGIALREADRAEQALVPLAEASRLDALDPRPPFETARTLRALLRRDEAAAHAAQADALNARLATPLPLR